MIPGVLALTPANPPEPSYMGGSSEGIDVDGNTADYPYGEWDLDDDFFADMNKAGPFYGNPNPVLLSKLYLRYDCNNGILYVMVLLNDSINHEINIDESDKLFVKVNATDDINDTVLVNNVIPLVNGNTGANNVAPALHYIEDNGKIIGWEASTPLSAGTYRLCVRTQVDTSDGVKTSGTGESQIGIPLLIECSPGPQIPEFPTIALPVMAILGLMFIFGRKRDL